MNFDFLWQIIFLDIIKSAWFKILIFFTAEPLPLLDLCRRVIRQTITKERIEQGKIAELNLPKTIKDYLEYKDRRVATEVS